jgi:hypothetical protein
MIKSFLSLLLLFAILFNFTGTFIVFKVQQAQIRKSIKQQIKSGISEDELHFFRLTQAEYEQLDWERPDIEFHKDNEMFDIVRSEKVGDSIHLYCVNDKEEKVLFAQLDVMIQKKMEQDSRRPTPPISKVAKVLKLVYVTAEFSFQITSISCHEKTDFSPVNSFYRSHKLEVLTPPPNAV